MVTWDDASGQSLELEVTWMFAGVVTRCKVFCVCFRVSQRFRLTMVRAKAVAKWGGYLARTLMRVRW